MAKSVPAAGIVGRIVSALLGLHALVALAQVVIVLVVVGGLSTTDPETGLMSPMMNQLAALGELASRWLLVAYGLLLFVCGIFFLSWVGMALAVKRRGGHILTHSPTWGVVCFFVPIISLFVPHQVLMELWESGSGTYHGRGRHLVTAWWLLFLGSRFFGVFTSMWESGVDEYDISALISYNIVVVVQNLLLGAAATSGALMVYRITRRQEQPEGVPGDVADVFA